MPVSRNVRKNNKKKPYRGHAATHRPVSVVDWTSLEAYYQHLRTYAAQAGVVVGLARDERLKAALEDVNETTRLMNTLLRDLQHFTTALESLHERHAGRTGKHTDHDNLADMIEAAEHYDFWFNSYASVVLPTVRQLAEQFDAARVRIEQENAQTTPAPTAEPVAEMIVDSDKEP